MTSKPGVRRPHRCDPAAAARRGPAARALRAGAALPAIAALLACSDSTGPPDEPSGVTGTWSYQASQMEGSGEEHEGTCSVTAGTLTLTQNGSTVTGTAESLAVSCEFDGQPHDYMAGGPISAGQVQEGAISFHLGAGWRHAGTVSGHTMSGTAQLDVTVNEDEFTLEGAWTAQRQGATGPGYGYRDG